jgi:hypothetical protein
MFEQEMSELGFVGLKDFRIKKGIEKKEKICILSFNPKNQ